MTIKEYLSQTFTLSKEIKAKTQQILQLREMQSNISGVLIGERVQASVKIDKIGCLLADIDELEQSYIQDVQRLFQLKNDIKKAIENIGRSDYKLILEERYINLKRWEDIAADNHYSWDTVHRKHREALENIRIESYTLNVV